jgi:hypothetical protein
MNTSGELINRRRREPANRVAAGPVNHDRQPQDRLPQDRLPQVRLPLENTRRLT